MSDDRSLLNNGGGSDDDRYTSANRNGLSGRAKRALIAGAVILVAGLAVGLGVGLTVGKGSSGSPAVNPVEGVITPQVPTAKTTSVPVTPQPTPDSAPAPTPISSPTPAPTPVEQPPAPTPGNADPPSSTGGSTLAPTSLQAKIDGLTQILKPSYPNSNVLTTVDTDQHKAVKWLAGNTNLGSYDNLVKMQRYALAVFFYKTNGEKWLRKSYWMTSASECLWHGITCESGAVSRIKLEKNLIDGAYPSVEMGMLKDNLKEFSVSKNKLRIDNLSSLSNFPKLEVLELTENIVLGKIPPQLSALDNMKTFRVAKNSLTGTFPDEFFDLTNLEVLSLGGNSFKELPSKINQLTKLQVLEFGKNNADQSNAAPKSKSIFGHLFTRKLSESYILPSLTSLKSLKVLNMTSHIPPFVGQIPADYGQLPKLEKLDVSHNSLTGELPSDIYKLTELNELFIEYNQIQGKLSASIADLTSLDFLTINNNNITGPIPTQIGKIPFLKNFIANDNQLTGTIPPELDNFLFTRIHLGNNFLEGPIPINLSTPTFIIDLSLKNNIGLNGTISEDFSKLKRLRTFELHGTNVTGSMPNGVCALRESYSKFTGECATGQFNCSCCIGCLPPSMQPTFVPTKSPTVPPGPTTKSPTKSPSLMPTRDISKVRDIINSYLPERSYLLDENHTDTHQYKAMQWLNKDPYFDYYPDNKKMARYALVVFYLATNGDKWIAKTRWNTHTEECNWSEVICDSFGNIKALNLYDNEMSGELPYELTLLNETLLVLSLAENDLSNKDLVFLSKLTRLERLDFDNNKLSATIPTEFGLLTNLWDFRMRSNKNLTGTIPTEIGLMTKLVNMEISHNWLTGTVPWEHFEKLTSVQKFKAHKNTLQGNLTSGIGSMTSLKVFDVYYNDIGGLVPWNVFTKMKKLDTLALGSNFFTGTLSTEIGELSFLEYLDLSFNKFNKMVPTEIGKLKELEEFYIHANQLEGFLPSEIGNLQELSTLTLNNNYVEGMPVEYGNLSNLRTLRLAYNWFTEIIPTQWGNMKELSEFTLDHNYFSGPLPTELGNLSELETLRLEMNDYLYGAIPSELGKLKSLTNFNISKTAVSGPIAPEICALRTKSLADLESDCGGANPEVTCSCCSKCHSDV